MFKMVDFANLSSESERPISLALGVTNNGFMNGGSGP